MKIIICLLITIVSSIILAIYAIITDGSYGSSKTIIPFTFGWLMAQLILFIISH